MNVNWTQFSVPFFIYAICFGQSSREKKQNFLYQCSLSQVWAFIWLKPNFFQIYLVYEVFWQLARVENEQNIFSSVPIQFMNVNGTQVTFCQRNVKWTQVTKKGTCNALLVSIGKDLSCCCGKYFLSCILSPKNKKIRKYHYTFWQIQLQQVLKKQEFFFKCCLAKQDKMKEWCHFLLHQLHTIVKTNHYQR